MTKSISFNLIMYIESYTTDGDSEYWHDTQWNGMAVVHGSKQEVMEKLKQIPNLDQFDIDAAAETMDEEIKALNEEAEDDE
jgi:hypothetical protein